MYFEGKRLGIVDKIGKKGSMESDGKSLEFYKTEKYKHFETEVINPAREITAKLKESAIKE